MCVLKDKRYGSRQVKTPVEGGDNNIGVNINNITKRNTADNAIWQRTLQGWSQQSQSSLSVYDPIAAAEAARQRQLNDMPDFDRVMITNPVVQATSDYILTAGVGGFLKSSAQLYATKATINGLSQFRQNGQINVVDMATSTFAPGNIYGKIVDNTLPNLFDLSLSPSGMTFKKADLTTIDGIVNFTAKTAISTGVGFGTEQLQNYSKIGSNKNYYLTRNGQLGITTFGERTENHYQSVWEQYWNK